MKTYEEIFVESLRAAAEKRGRDFATWDEYDDYDKERVSAGIDAVIKESERRNGWIPCSERMPTEADGERVHFTATDDGIWTATTEWIIQRPKQAIAWKPTGAPYTPPAPTPEEIERKEFEEWYVTHAFDLKLDPIGSRQCSLQWAAWQAARKAAK